MASCVISGCPYLFGRPGLVSLLDGAGSLLGSLLGGGSFLTGSLLGGGSLRTGSLRTGSLRTGSLRVGGGSLRSFRGSDRGSGRTGSTFRFSRGLYSGTFRTSGRIGSLSRPSFVLGICLSGRTGVSISGRTGRRRVTAPVFRGSPLPVPVPIPTPFPLLSGRTGVRSPRIFISINF